MFKKLSIEVCLLFLMIVCQHVYADVLLSPTIIVTRNGIKESDFTYEFTDEHSDECEENWFVLNRISKKENNKEVTCWTNNGEYFEIKASGLFSRNERFKKPPEIGMKDLTKETAQLVIDKKRRDKEVEEAREAKQISQANEKLIEKINVSGYPSQNISQILSQLPPAQFIRFCTFPQVLAEIKERLNKAKKLNIVEVISNGKTYQASGGLDSGALDDEYACDVDLITQSNVKLHGMATVKYSRKSKNYSVGWTENGKPLDVNDIRYGIEPLKKIDPNLQQYCWDQQTFANVVDASKRGGMPYELMRQQAASYDQNNLRRVNLDSLQARTHVYRTVDPLTAIDLANSRVAVVDLAYKNPEIYKSYIAKNFNPGGGLPRGLPGFVYDKCMDGKSMLESKNTTNEPEARMENAKEKCISLGFKAGTESFGQCILRLAK